jgi:hypothetical protein
MLERRLLPRIRVLRHVKLIVGADAPLVPCTVHDLTAAGARLALACTEALPDLFELTFDHGRSRRSCRVVWRGPAEIGVAFDKR